MCLDVTCAGILVTGWFTRASNTKLICTTLERSLLAPAPVAGHATHWTAPHRGIPHTLSLLLIVLAVLARAQPDVGNGRVSSEHHSPRCCVARDCITTTGPSRSAFVTSIRSPDYMVLLRELQCSLHLTNPGIPLIVLGVADELPAELVEEIETYAEYKTVPNIEFPNTNNPRFSKNWFKLNAWNFTDYTSLILLDADIVVLSDITHLFDLPTDFAWAPYNAPNWGYNKGGFIMLRPCAPVFKHMLEIVQADESKRYASDFAEQTFIAWYFKNTGFRLPMIYNANFVYLEKNGDTASGAKPLVVHFASNKPMHVTENDADMWEYMCYRYSQHHHKPAPRFIP